MSCLDKEAGLQVKISFNYVPGLDKLGKNNRKYSNSKHNITENREARCLPLPTQPNTQLSLAPTYSLQTTPMDLKLTNPVIQAVINNQHINIFRHSQIGRGIIAEHQGI